MEIVSIIFPVFFIAVLGYVLTWLGAFRVEDIAGLTRYVFNIALPIMLFDSMSRIALPEQIQWTFLLAYYIPAVAIYFIGAAVGHTLFGHTRTEQGIYGMGCAYSNTVLIGLPIVSTAWGDRGVLPLMMIVSIHTAILFTLTTAVAESGLSRGGSGSDAPGKRTILVKTAIGMLRNPIFGGLIAGLIWNRTGLGLPAPLATAITWIRESALPAALFVTGASLRQYRIAGHIGAASAMIGMKLLVHPVLVWILGHVVFDIPPLWTGVAVLTAALPTGVNVSVFAAKYDAAVAPVVTGTLISTF
ncbi:MAG: AEC family transporter, partial [Alkalispirochaeta sp.]